MSNNKNYEDADIDMIINRDSVYISLLQEIFLDESTSVHIKNKIANTMAALDQHNYEFCKKNGYMDIYNSVHNEDLK